MLMSKTGNTGNVDNMATINPTQNSTAKRKAQAQTHLAHEALGLAGHDEGGLPGARVDDEKLPQVQLAVQRAPVFIAVVVAAVAGVRSRGRDGMGMLRDFGG